MADLTISNLSANAVSNIIFISWSNAEENALFDVEYKLATNTNYTTAYSNTTDRRVSINVNSYNTLYDIRVRVKVDGETGEYYYIQATSGPSVPKQFLGFVSFSFQGVQLSEVIRGDDFKITLKQQTKKIKKTKKSNVVREITIGSTCEIKASLPWSKEMSETFISRENAEIKGDITVITNKENFICRDMTLIATETLDFKDGGISRITLKFVSTGQFFDLEYA